MQLNDVAVILLMLLILVSSMYNEIIEVSMPTAGEILTLSPGNEKFHYPPSVKNFSTILELQN
jgi:hypothetical protein